ncbi:hypothetical protein YC2023_060785 [Brassica napus]
MLKSAVMSAFKDAIDRKTPLMRFGLHVPNIAAQFRFDMGAKLAKADMATASGNGGGDRTAEAVVAGQISQAVNSTANLLHLIRQSSSAKVYS